MSFRMGSKDIASTYGEKSDDPVWFITAAANIICAMVYARLATPAACPRKLHQPMTQAQMATCSGGTTCFVTKYMPPAVGYAETNSATLIVSFLLSLVIAVRLT